MTWFKFNALDSRDFGVLVNTYPPRVRAKERLERLSIPGRHGELTLREDYSEPTYESVVYPVECTLMPEGGLDLVLAWLGGDGHVIFGDEPDYRRDCVIEDEIVVIREYPGTRYRSFTVKFTCQPYKTLVTPAAAIDLTEGGTLVNPGTLPSLPRITVEGDGEIFVYMGSYRFSLNLDHETVHIDCDTRTATSLSGLQNKLDLMSGDFPRIMPGNTSVAVSAGIDSMTVLPRWRWLG